MTRRVSTMRGCWPGRPTHRTDTALGDQVRVAAGAKELTEAFALGCGRERLTGLQRQTSGVGFKDCAGLVYHADGDDALAFPLAGRGRGLRSRRFCAQPEERRKDEDYRYDGADAP